MNSESSAGTSEMRRTNRLGLWLITAAIAGFVVWALTAPLNEGVPTQAVVSIDTKSVAVQHLQGGLIREVFVREGQRVQAGDLLMRLDEASTRADYEAVRQRYLGLRAMEGRLLAEQRSLPEIEFHPDLIHATDDPHVARHIDNQKRLLTTRREALRAELQAIEESIRGQDSIITTTQGMLESRREQLAIVREEIARSQDLVADGFLPRNRMLELHRQQADVTAAITELQGNLDKARLSTLELRQRAVLRQKEVLKEVETQLADVVREVESDYARYAALRDDLARTEIRAGADGQVVGLAFQSVGGVIPPGQRIAHIVPHDQDLLLETRILPHLIDSVRPQLPVDIRFAVFPTSPMLVVSGEVLTVSGDLLTDQDTGATYFLARVRVTEEGRTQLQGRLLQPGMPAEVIIRTGERTLFSYLIHPLTRRVAASLTEH